MTSPCTCGGAQRIAELEQQLRRKTVELEVRLNPPSCERNPGFLAGWSDKPLVAANWTNGYGEYLAQRHAAGKAAVEAAINRRMEGGNGE